MHKKPFVIHPFLFAIFPILFLVSHNVAEVSYHEALVPAAIVLGFTLLLLLLSGLILRNDIKAGIVVSAFLMFFFSYGRVSNVIWLREIGSFVITHRHILLTWSCSLLVVLILLIRTHRNLRNLTKILNISLCITIALGSVNTITIYHLFFPRGMPSNGGFFLGFSAYLL